MKSKIVPISNVARLSEAGTALLERPMGMPGMGLVFGPSGFGKTTAIAWLATRHHGVYVRARATPTPRSLLAGISRELGNAPSSTNDGTVEDIVQKLAETGRPLFIDEGDYLVNQTRLVETLRDIHDLSSVPVILVGMAGINRKIAGRKQLAGRIAQWVEFQPASSEDAQLLAKQLAEVEIEPALVATLHQQAAGEVRLIAVGLNRIENLARSRGLSKIGPKEWPADEGFFLNAEPRRGLRAVG